MDIDFRDPPKAGGYLRIDHAELTARLKERPGKWAMVPREYANANTARSMATYMKTGRSHYAPKGAFEAVTRTEGGLARVWVRYIGEALKETG